MLSDPIVVKAAAVMIGLFWGAMWKAAYIADKTKSWKAVKFDIMISAMIGGANAILTLTLADLAHAGPLLTMAFGVGMGATGLRALPEIKAAFITSMRRKLLGDDIAYIPPKDEELSEMVQRLKVEEDQK